MSRFWRLGRWWKLGQEATTGSERKNRDNLKEDGGLEPPSLAVVAVPEALHRPDVKPGDEVLCGDFIVDPMGGEHEAHGLCIRCHRLDTTRRPEGKSGRTEIQGQSNDQKDSAGATRRRPHEDQDSSGEGELDTRCTRGREGPRIDVLPPNFLVSQLAGYEVCVDLALAAHSLSRVSSRLIFAAFSMSSIVSQLSSAGGGTTPGTAGGGGGGDSAGGCSMFSSVT